MKTRRREQTNNLTQESSFKTFDFNVSSKIAIHELRLLSSFRRNESLILKKRTRCQQRWYEHSTWKFVHFRRAFSIVLIDLRCMYVLMRVLKKRRRTRWEYRRGGGSIMPRWQHVEGSTPDEDVSANPPPLPNARNALVVTTKTSLTPPPRS